MGGIIQVITMTSMGFGLGEMVRGTLNNQMATLLGGMLFVGIAMFFIISDE